MLAFQFLISVQVKMGSSSHLITTMMDSTAKDSSKPKKFSPFSVDSLLATKVKQQKSDPHQLLDNNNTKTEPKSVVNVNKQLTSADDLAGNSNSDNVVDLSLKKEESSGNSIVDEDLDLGSVALLSHNTLKRSVILGLSFFAQC